MPLIAQRLRTWLWGGHELLRLGRPDVAIAFLGGLGDELLCTVPLVEWRSRGARNVWVRTRKRELFAGLDQQVHILPDDPRYDRLAQCVGRPFRFLSYSLYDAKRDQDIPQPRHIITEMCARAGLSGTIKLRPHWRVSDAERAHAARWGDHVAIQTSTLDAHVPMRNKQWPAERFNEVVAQLAPCTKFVQVGTASDPVVSGAVDLRGKTSLRETAAILASVRAFVGLVGFLMHLARAVECPAVIIYGGRETPALTGYPCNLNLVRQVACAPCWQRSLCDFDRVCMSQISTDEVVAAATDLLSRPRSPLAFDLAEL